jgi:hypothetical protein
MRRKIAVGILGLAVLVAGVVSLVAFTAQQVNIEARVEKEIEVEAVLCDFVIDPVTGAKEIDPETCKIASGDYGVVLPQRFYDKYIEVTLSKSFFKQTEVTDVQYDVLWECKQVKGPPNVSNLWNNFFVGADGKYNVPIWDEEETNSFGEKLNIPDCREKLPGDHVLELDGAGNPVHAGPELDGRIRDHAVVSAFPAIGFPNNFCLVGGLRLSEDEFDTAKDLEYLGTGIVDNSDGLTKCFYQIKLDAPPCIQGFNPWTDPRGGNSAPEDERKTPIDCHTNRDELEKVGGDPQDIETFAQLGDEFKIQVTFHSVD